MSGESEMNIGNEHWGVPPSQADWKGADRGAERWGLMEGQPEGWGQMGAGPDGGAGGWGQMGVGVRWRGQGSSSPSMLAGFWQDLAEKHELS